MDNGFQLKAEGQILLVEDNFDDADLALRALKRNQIDVEVVVVRDGVEALEYLFPSDSEPRIPSLVVLDLKLPRLNGLEVLRCIRADKRTRFVPVVVLSTSLEPGDVTQSYNKGCNSYLKKPIDFREFTAMVQDLALYWLKRNESPPKDTVVARSLSS